MRIVAFAVAVAVSLLCEREAKALPRPAMSIVEVGLTERVVMDHVSGVALYGYDPVAYFTKSAAVYGKAEFEYIWRGAAWRFANAGNMAAFMASPSTYAPRFGGYDASAVAKGIAAAGNPRVFLIADRQLYLFRDEDSRAAFLESADARNGSAAAWPAIERRLMN